MRGCGVSRKWRGQPRDELGRFARKRPERRRRGPGPGQARSGAKKPVAGTKRPRAETRRPVPETKKPVPETRKLVRETKQPKPGRKTPLLEKRRAAPPAKKKSAPLPRRRAAPELSRKRAPEEKVSARQPRRDAYGRFLPERRRDEQGKFAPETYGPVRKPRRDEAGRFAPKPVRKPAKKPTKRRRPRPERPLVAERSRQAEVLIQERLLELRRLLLLLEPGLAMDVQTFVNKDGTVDGMLRVGNLPDEWRQSGTFNLLAATLSSALRDWSPFDARPAMGGSFWVSFGVRFGPRSQAEALAMEEFYRRYKRHRGLPQIGTYPTPAWNTGALQLALVGDATGMRAMVRNFVEKRGLAPAAILVRIIWMTDSSRPGHYRGEK